jgi:hypothetical protein
MSARSDVESAFAPYTKTRSCVTKKTRIKPSERELRGKLHEEEN